MTQKEFLEAFTDEQVACAEIVIRKNSDYSADEEAMLNFNFIEMITRGRVSTEDGILTRMTDKVARLGKILDRNDVAAVQDESVLDTLRDLANYALICAVAWQERTKELRRVALAEMANDRLDSKMQLTSERANALVQDPLALQYAPQPPLAPSLVDRFLNLVKK